MIARWWDVRLLSAHLCFYPPVAGADLIMLCSSQHTGLSKDYLWSASLQGQRSSPVSPVDPLPHKQPLQCACAHPLAHRHGCKMWTVKKIQGTEEQVKWHPEETIRQILNEGHFLSQLVLGLYKKSMSLALIHTHTQMGWGTFWIKRNERNTTNVMYKPLLDLCSIKSSKGGNFWSL